jgi:hypothetical protein
MLTKEEYNLIRESLKYSLQGFENYQGYPSVEFKTEKAEFIKSLLRKLTKIRQDLV